ncbi:hypothetical protein GALMADRAFT_822495 [Galerina marginata CBS 339.88]|uniref:Uncharacterized protein n=1 Tax=Galerina marginata (strain CBS 339.88) TaxID=685588 RepID=A0A067TTX8_GALM3|nr:hypothetical protein GALMADRAFT_822495 [Galerina marginata CBS 339.88]
MYYLSYLSMFIQASHRSIGYHEPCLLTGVRSLQCCVSSSEKSKPADYRLEGRVLSAQEFSTVPCSDRLFRPCKSDSICRSFLVYHAARGFGQDEESCALIRARRPVSCTWVVLKFSVIVGERRHVMLVGPFPLSSLKHGFISYPDYRCFQI